MSNNPNKQQENVKMKHNYYCIVPSLRCVKTFNRVSQITIIYYECLSAALVTQQGWDSVVCIVGPGIESWWGEIFCTRLNQHWGPPNLLYNGYWVFPRGKGGRGVMLTAPT
jgi:hypothetical protein